MGEESHSHFLLLNIFEVLFLDGNEFKEIEEDGINLFYILFISIFDILVVFFDSYS